MAMKNIGLEAMRQRLAGAKNNKPMLPSQKRNIGSTGSPHTPSGPISKWAAGGQR